MPPDGMRYANQDDLIFPVHCYLNRAFFLLRGVANLYLGSSDQYEAIR
jgi:hypothetical protein